MLYNLHVRSHNRPASHTNSLHVWVALYPGLYIEASSLGVSGLSSLLYEREVGEKSEMSTQRTYRIADSQLTIDFGSVLDAPAEVVVSSDDYLLSMGGGVSAAIRTAAGNALVLDAAKAVPREAGDVVVTTAGALSARYVFHVVTIGPGYWDDRSEASAREVVGLVRRATRNCLELMQPLSVRSIVFPALGTGTAGYPIEASAAAMADVVNDVLSQSNWPLNVSIMLMSRGFASPVQYVAFYERYSKPCFRGNAVHSRASEEISRHAAEGN